MAIGTGDGSFSPVVAALLVLVPIVGGGLAGDGSDVGTGKAARTVGA